MLFKLIAFVMQHVNVTAEGKISVTQVNHSYSKCLKHAHYWNCSVSYNVLEELSNVDLGIF